MVTLGQKKHFETWTQSKISILCILQTRNFLSPKVILLYIVGKYMENGTNFNKRAYAENELVTSYKALITKLIT